MFLCFLEAGPCRVIVYPHTTMYRVIYIVAKVYFIFISKGLLVKGGNVVSAHGGQFRAGQFSASGHGGRLVEGSRDTRAVVVLGECARTHIPVKGDFHAFLGVDTQPLPAVPASSAQVTGCVAESGGFLRKHTVLEVLEVHVTRALTCAETRAVALAGDTRPAGHTSRTGGACALHTVNTAGLVECGGVLGELAVETH